MEDLATSEISRSQLWQWLKFGAKLDDGRAITFELYERWLGEELAAIRQEYGEAVYGAGHFPSATTLFMDMVRSRDFPEFMSLPAYELLP
jgi:malate synthase